MARRDRTGPMGMGPMTGRRAGYCAGDTAPGYANPGPGRGFGMGYGGGFGWCGGGRGWRHRHRERYDYGPAGDVLPLAPRMTREQEVDMLKTQANDLQEMLKGINDRLSKLEQE